MLRSKGLPLCHAANVGAGIMAEDLFAVVVRIRNRELMHCAFSFHFTQGQW